MLAVRLQLPIKYCPSSLDRSSGLFLGGAIKCQTSSRSRLNAAFYIHARQELTGYRDYLRLLVAVQI